MLKRIRLVVALLIYLLLTFYFIDFAGILPKGFSVLAKFQFVPSLLSWSLGILLGLLLLTFIFGRFYCSSVCPLGVMQDIFSWISGKVNKKRRFKYRKPLTILRWSVVGICVVAFLLGLTVVVSLLDPYSAYGRVATHIFKPVYIAGNNLLAWTFNQFDNYKFYFLEVTIVSMVSFITASVTLLIVGYLSFRYGRLYCNTICPVGTVLGLFSRKAPFRVRMDKEKCTRCGLCAMKCKSSCIDVKEQAIDNSRCVDCFNCLGSCKSGALSYKYANDFAQQEESVVSESRRRFLGTALLTTIALPEAMAQNRQRHRGKGRNGPEHPLSPPGSQSHAHLLKHCTACHLCVSKCPSNILKPAFMEYGIGGVMQPVMSFEKGFCNFDCTLCSEVCPNGAILPLTRDEKHRTQVGKVVFRRKNCVVFTEETNCGACSEHCPTQAVTMEPYKDGLTIPRVNVDLCVGCGGCEFICPRPRRAIYVEGNTEHQKAVPFKEAEKKEVNLDGFGF